MNGNHRELDEFIQQLRCLSATIKAVVDGGVAPDLANGPMILGQVEQVLAGMAQRIRQLEQQPVRLPDDNGPLAEQALHALMAYVVSRSHNAGVP